MQPGGPLSPITSSSLLQHLSLADSTLSSSSRNQLLWGQLFRADQQLPHLTSLELSFTIPWLHTYAVERVARSCPHLQQLHIEHGTWQPPEEARDADDGPPLVLGRGPVDFGALLQLSALTLLALADADDSACTQVLARMTQLRQLGLVQAWVAPSVAALRGLTALTALTALHYTYGGCCLLGWQMRTELELRSPQLQDINGWATIELTSTVRRCIRMCGRYVTHSDILACL